MGAIAALDQVLADLVCVGPITNQAFLRRAITHPEFVAAHLDTGFISRHGDALLAEPPGGLEPALIAVSAKVLAERQVTALEHAGALGEPGSPWAQTDGWRANVAKTRDICVPVR